MERKLIDEFITTTPYHKRPYLNHHGGGIGFGTGSLHDSNKGGRYTYPNNNYNGNDIMYFNGNKVYHINGYTLYITHVRKPWAIAEIIKNDLTTQKCYIGKIKNHIVIANSVREALDELRTHIQNTGDNINDIAEAFVYMHPLYEKEYDWEEMVFWHSLDSTSCLDGRRKFSQNANKQEGSTATPKELIHFMKQTKAYKIAEKMEELYLSKE